MKNQLRYVTTLFVLTGLFLFNTSCNSGNTQKSSEPEQGKSSIMLTDKTLSEVKELINGKWELITGQNTTELGEFENTFITFKGDEYVWTENNISEPGEMNWRKEATGIGYDAWLMDVFYADSPSFPLAIKGDTLYIQDCTETAYKYTLVRRK